MKTKIQIKTIWGSLLYEHEAEGNTVKNTIEEAVKSKVNLVGVNLGGANLGGVNLGGVNLGGANLVGANLGGANLGGANLGGANLVGADLGGANLGGVNLVGANLGGANLGEGWGKIESSSDVLCIGVIGSRNAYTTVFHTDKGIFVKCGCFRGTLDEFADKVKETHAGTKYERDYNALIEFVKIKFSDYDTQTN